MCSCRTWRRAPSIGLASARAELRAANPRLVTCSISGYGSGGPAAERKAYDLLIQAEAGFLSVTGSGDQMAKAGISIADIAAGVTAYHSILAALLHRATTGRGDHIEVSMLEAMAEWMGFPMYFAFDGAAPPPRNGAGHATIYPYGPYDTADGSVFFGLQNDREWAAFAEGVLERPDLAADPRFKGNAGRANHRDVLEPVITGVLVVALHAKRPSPASNAPASRRRASATWRRCGSIRSLKARNRWGEFGSPAGPLPGLKPVSGDGWEPRFDPVPALGEHTQSILAEFGLAEPARAEGQKNDPEARPPSGNARGAARRSARVFRRNTTASTTRRRPIPSSSSTR